MREETGCHCCLPHHQESPKSYLAARIGPKGPENIRRTTRHILEDMRQTDFSDSPEARVSRNGQSKYTQTHAHQVSFFAFLFCFRLWVSCGTMAESSLFNWDGSKSTAKSAPTPATIAPTIPTSISHHPATSSSTIVNRSQNAPRGGRVPVGVAETCRA